MLKICKVTRRGLSDTSRLIRHLPVKQGGLGIRSLGTIGPLAFVASVLHSSQLLFKRQRSFVMDLILPHARPALNPITDAVREVERRFVTDDRQLKIWPVNGEDQVRVQMNLPTQKELTLDDDKEKLEDFKESLPLDDPFGSAWFVSGQHRWSYSWINYYTDPIQLLHIKPEAFRLGITRRGLLNPPPDADLAVQTTVCSLCKEVGGDPRFHALSCTQNQGKRLRRHDKVVNAVAYFLSRAQGTAAVSKEYQLPVEGCELRADIRVCHPANGQVYLLDVTIVNPACKKYVRTTDCVREADAAGDKAFDEKCAKYLPFVSMMALPDYSFIPVVFEATGRLNNKSASALLPLNPSGDDGGDLERAGRRWRRDPADEPPKRIQFTLRRISAILVDWAEEMQRDYEAAVRELVVRPVTVATAVPAPAVVAAAAATAVEAVEGTEAGEVAELVAEEEGAAPVAAEEQAL